ncbi:ABC transporter permease [Marinitoga aeolica]|uniref:ABC transporter permease n=1 Tax=Marinitoga aeolica TaxID=2809031 RepID=A0ABY8PNZ3_9BACT|nr:ABC transporter permease [Marinitoga aeolica]WGS64349.1 ABC transporter permease [Marinitoga aeolica]
MKELLTLVKKDWLIRKKYKFIWINMALTPFFMIGPYIFTSKLFGKIDFSESILIGTLLWYWLNQYFWGVGDGFGEERAEGTLTSIIISPISLLKFLFSKSIDTFLTNIYLTIFTLIFFAISGITIKMSIWIFILLLMSGIYITFFSIFFAALALWKKKIGSMNYAVQYFVGLLSGMTSSIEYYPIYIKMISYIIPLTYLISLGRNIIKKGIIGKEDIFLLIVLTIISLIYLIIGILMLNKVERYTREKGEWESW